MLSTSTERAAAPARPGITRGFFPGRRVVGFDYRAQYPWEAAEEFPGFFEGALREHGRVTLTANSIGAFFAMSALSGEEIERAFFISPIVDMEGLILRMMGWAGVSEEELRRLGTVATGFGETLSYEYLNYVREHPIHWRAKTHILWGGRDELTPRETVTRFAEQTGAELTVMENGEHWFHTEEQMEFLDRWIEKSI